MLWTFTPLPFMLKLEHVSVPYVSLFISLLTGLVLNALLRGEPAYFKQTHAAAPTNQGAA